MGGCPGFRSAQLDEAKVKLVNKIRNSKIWPLNVLWAIILLGIRRSVLSSKKPMFIDTVLTWVDLPYLDITGHFKQVPPKHISFL